MSSDENEMIDLNSVGPHSAGLISATGIVNSIYN